MKKLYTPGQVGVGAFVFGPLAAVYFLKANFDTLSMQSESSATVWYGVLLTIVVSTISAFLPADFPLFILPGIFTLTAILIVSNQQMTKDDITKSDDYAVEDNINIFNFGIAALVAVFILLFGISALMVFLEVN